jgi:hypothetical protein
MTPGLIPSAARQYKAVDIEVGNRRLDLSLAVGFDISLQLPTGRREGAPVVPATDSTKQPKHEFAILRIGRGEGRRRGYAAMGLSLAASIIVVESTM